MTLYDTNQIDFVGVTLPGFCLDHIAFFLSALFAIDSFRFYYCMGTRLTILFEFVDWYDPFFTAVKSKRQKNLKKVRFFWGVKGSVL